ncbi:MAG: hypothetical protein AAB360_03105, partial [Patescibacteria group bacterium]
TWDGGGADSNWATAANWSADTAPVVGDDVVFNSTSYKPAVGVSDTVTDDLNSITMSGLNWDGGGNLIRTSVVDTTNHFIYYGTYESPARIIKVNAATNQPVAVLSLNTGENKAISSAIDITNGFAYFGTEQGGGANGYAVKIALSTFTRNASYSFSGNNPWALVLSPNGAYIFAGVSSGHIRKIQTSDMTLYGSILTLNAGENDPRAAVADATHAYFLSYTAPAVVVKVQMSDNTRTGALAFASGENYGYSAVTDGTYGYFGLNLNPARVVKVNLSTMTTSDATLTFNANEGVASSAAIDVANGFAYFGTGTSAGRIVKVQTSNNTRSNAITLSSGENIIWALGIDSTNLFAGTYTSYGRSVQVNLTSFTRTGAQEMGYSLYLQKHAISSSGTGAANNYRWDLETMTVNSGYV